MSAPVIFGDPEALMKAYLAAQFAPRSETYKPATITASFPSRSLVGAWHIQVENELGNADDYPVVERAQVRFTCHGPHDNRSDVKSLASLTEALVYSHPDVNRILIGRSDVIVDPDTKNLMVWFLARLNVKPTLLAS